MWKQPRNHHVEVFAYRIPPPFQHLSLKFSLSTLGTCRYLFLVSNLSNAILVDIPDLLNPSPVTLAYTAADASLTYLTQRSTGCEYHGNFKITILTGMSKIIALSSLSEMHSVV